MKARLWLIYNYMGIPAFIFHEFSHLIVALLLYPLGSKIISFRIMVQHASNGAFVSGGSVGTRQKYKPLGALVSLAPFITWLFWYVYLLFNHNILALYFGIWYGGGFAPSSGDLENTKYYLGLPDSKPNAIQDDKAKEIEKQFGHLFDASMNTDFHKTQPV